MRLGNESVTVRMSYHRKGHWFPEVHCRVAQRKRILPLENLICFEVRTYPVRSRVHCLIFQLGTQNVRTSKGAKGALDKKSTGDPLGKEKVEGKS